MVTESRQPETQPEATPAKKRGFSLGGLLLLCAAVAAVLAWFTRPGQGEELPALYPMPAFSLTSEQGRPFGSEEVQGEVLVANFIFTRCPTVCPLLSTRMAELQKRLAGKEGVRLLSFSVDPKNDTPEVLRAFGQAFGQDPSRWSFLTGDFQAVREAVEAGFKVGMDGAEDPDADPFDIVHGEQFVLVDKAGVIRGYYQVGDEEGLARLVRDAGRLLRERR